MKDLLKFLPYTISRPSDGTWSFGKYTQGTPTSHTIRASIQPVSGKELDQLPEGDRFKSHIEIYTENSIYVKDVITYKDEKFEVIRVSDYSDYCLEHYEALAIRIDNQ